MGCTPLTKDQVKDVEWILGRKMTEGEHKLLDADHSMEYGFFQMDPEPRNGRQMLLIYTSCWGRGIRQYLRTYRKDVLDRYWIFYIVDYALVLSCFANKRFPIPEILNKAWQKADAVIYSPVGSSYRELSSEYLLRFLKPDAKTAQFSSPSQGHLWSICPIVGEHGVHALFDKGLTDEQVFAKYMDGSFDPMFPIRHAEQRAFLKGKQSFGDIRLAEFLEKYFRNYRMFWTFAHPTFIVLAYCADQCVGKFGFETRPDDVILKTPIMDHIIGEIHPDDQYAWLYYKFTFMPDKAMEMGGPEFYRKAIIDARKRWKQPDPIGNNPVRIWNQLT